MNRREFIAMAAATASALVIPTNRDVAIERYEVEGNISQPDIAALEEVVKISTQTTHTKTTARPPQLILTLEIENVEGDAINGGMVSVVPKSVSSAYMFHPNGLFITTEHKYRDFSPEQRKNTIKLIYDPLSGRVSETRPLVRSGEDDILLGIASDRFNVPTTQIANNDLSATEGVYVLSYNNWNYCTGQLFRSLGGCGVVQYGSNGELKFKQERKLEARVVQDLGLKPAPSPNISLYSAEGVCKEGQYGTLFESEVGNSGSPVFNHYNRLMGINIGKNLAGGRVLAGNTNTTEVQTFNIYTGPMLIRNMIHWYIANQKQALRR